ncbi:MAG: PAS domain S-box protein [Thermoplasmata archaeon]|nr:PAS domain S-box protein [Thermoplasmata archaeon]
MLQFSESSLWILPTISVYVIVAWFVHLYLRDGDKRKLLFSVVFLLASIDYILSLINYPLSSNLVLYNTYLLLSVPLQVVILMAVVESIHEIKNFDRTFNISVVLLLFSFLMVFIPVSLREILKPVRILIAVAVIAVALYSLIKTKKPSSVMFLFSIVCFSVAGTSTVNNLTELAVFSYTLGYVFVALTFSVSLGYKGTESYFHLKRKLEDIEDALRESEKKYRLIVENTADVIILTEKNGMISYVSPSCKEVFGYSPEEFVGKKAWDFRIIYPEDLEEVSQHHRRIIEDGNSISNLEFRIVTKQGEIKWISYSCSPISENGKIGTFIGIARDISKRKEIEQRLVENVNELKRAERASLNIMEDLRDTVDRLEKARNEIMEKNRQLEETKKQLIALNRNLEKKVKERTEEIEKLLKKKEELIHQLSHDLKTPLTPLNTLLPLAKDLTKNPKAKELIDVCIKNVDYMKNLVTRILQLSRIDAITKPEIENVNLLEEVKKVIDSNSHYLEMNNINVEVMVDEDVVVRADRLRLKEVFNNLITNAVKYSPNGGTITIGAEKQGKEVKIFVRDTGIGLTEEQKKRVFDEFYKADESRQDFYSTGLGLTICKGIVEKHGGKIWAESEGLGKGSTFYFTLKSGRRGK